MRCAVLSAILVLAVSGGYAAQKPQSSDASGNGSAVAAPPAPSPSPAVSPDLNSDDEKAAEPAAQEPSAGTRVHRVWLWQETRDCLWNLAERYYGDPWQWKKIYLANQEQIEDPRVIFPKQELIIPPLEEGEKGK